MSQVRTALAALGASRRALAALGLWASLGGAGCGLQDATQFRPERCELDEDCGPGRSCREMVCVDLVNRRVAELAVELTPPPTASDLARTQLRGLTLPDGSEVLDFEMPEAAVFERTQVLDGEIQEPVAASVTISSADRIPGREVDARLSVAPAQITPLRLVPGTYAARVLPLDGQRPGLEVRNWVVRRAGRSPVKEFVLGARDRRLYGDVTLRTSHQEKLPGVRVRAISLPSGLSSTESRSDSEGRYEIELPDTEDTAFQLVATLADTEQPAWSFRQIVNVPRDEARRLDIGLEETGASSIGVANLTVLGIGQNGGPPEPVEAAAVTLTATTTLSTRSFSVRGRTDRSGRIVSETDGAPLLILSARYRVEVEPPPDAPYARTSTIIDLVRTGPSIQTDRQIALPRRALVQGRITSSLGQQLSQASVFIDDLDRVIRPIQRTTDDSGVFLAHLDPGRYLVRIEGGQTQQLTEAHPVAFARLDVSASELQVDFFHSLPAGRVVRGLVTRHDGRSAPAEVEVELFLEFERRSVSLGRTQAQPDGRYSLVISGVELEGQ